ncbi:nucleotidyltransferase domain-containing protein [Kineosporia babensis]|uniref:Amino acid transporter n=1 Tax=Kineosporia babensis TaxID=499548 RepID=A0A9X1NMJ9_9ACTN|nr:hypothetical protein [Kineosporia babensis]MCD5315876.1 hypothetical protein [Kineosporia babensis]
MPTNTPTGPPAPQPTDAQPLPPDDFQRWYGTWEPLNPGTISAFMHGFDQPWWIVGGWSIQAFTGISRPHDDMDISILASDIPAFRDFLGDRWTAWNADEGWLRPFDQRFTQVRPDSQLWIRRNAQSPWILDVPFTPDAGTRRWTNKRNPAHTENLEDVTWIAPDGLRYAKPEVTLMFKAAQAREKDRQDAHTTLPLLDERARTWLRDTMHRINPDHPWAH